MRVLPSRLGGASAATTEKLSSASASWMRLRSVGQLLMTEPTSRVLFDANHSAHDLPHTVALPSSVDTRLWLTVQDLSR